MNNQFDSIRAVAWTDDGLRLLDQRLLPEEERYLFFTDSGAVANAIRDMVVRGAPAIGITAAYAVVLAVRSRREAHAPDWRERLDTDLAELKQARPTAVNLAWAVERMRQSLQAAADDPAALALAEAGRIHEEDIAANRRMGELGAALIEPGCGVLTHCNTGSLATGGFGTALGVIRQAWAERRLTGIHAGETRPWLQGARLTAWELVRDGLPVSLVVDGAAAHLMARGKVQWVIVGADRIAANGDVANKIGTCGLAILARHFGVRFMVVAPTSTIDLGTPAGDDIPVELRDPEEVLTLGGSRVAAAGADAWNPAFDITPAELVDVLVTEYGVVERPDRDGIAALLARNPKRAQTPGEPR